ncbi:hypothetical protein BD779DRAFT_1477162 [Infundibulicybe gibba]|nr:hypothetical protein BD779DRAFT_1477162 [Infundibulicybe gibba]
MSTRNAASHRRDQKSTHGVRKKRTRKVMDKAARIDYLRKDRWTVGVMATTVQCAGCGKTVRLDGRSEYYPGLWDKHKGKCKGIQSEIAEVLLSLAAGPKGM